MDMVRAWCCESYHSVLLTGMGTTAHAVWQDDLKNCLNRTVTNEQKIFRDRRRLRLLYSLNDFQLASSAAAFLYECDPAEKYFKPDLRRFRCFETAAVVAYVRPFSQSKGQIPPLSLKMAGADLNEEQRKLHEELLLLRNKVFAHSDEDMMRMVSKPFSVPFRDGLDFVMFETIFDEGITFMDAKLRRFDELIQTLIRAVVVTLQKQAQDRPDDFDLRKDYLVPQSPRSGLK